MAPCSLRRRPARIRDDSRAWFMSACSHAFSRPPRTHGIASWRDFARVHLEPRRNSPARSSGRHTHRECASLHGRPARSKTPRNRVKHIRHLVVTDRQPTHLPDGRSADRLRHADRLRRRGDVPPPGGTRTAPRCRRRGAADCSSVPPAGGRGLLLGARPRGKVFEAGRRRGTPGPSLLDSRRPCGHLVAARPPPAGAARGEGDSRVRAPRGPESGAGGAWPHPASSLRMAVSRGASAATTPRTPGRSRLGAYASPCRGDPAAP
jgi:hypothetical protein